MITQSIGAARSMGEGNVAGKAAGESTRSKIFHCRPSISKKERLRFVRTSIMFSQVFEKVERCGVSVWCVVLYLFESPVVRGSRLLAGFQVLTRVEDRKTSRLVHSNFSVDLFVLPLDIQRM